jgi:uncharacterized membrane protein (DUF485 family)
VNHLHPVQSTVFYFMWQCLFYFMLFHMTVPILHSLRTCTSCASLLQFLSTWIICTQYSLCSSTSCDNDFYSTVHQQPACSLHSLLRLQHVHAHHVPLCYSSCLRESFAPSTVYVLLLHATMISTVHLQLACSLLQHPVIDLYKVETNARLHFTHQTETSLYFDSYISGTLSPFSYSYISPTFSWQLQQKRRSSAPQPTLFLSANRLFNPGHFGNIFVTTTT